MLIKGLTDEDFVNYKKPSMFIATPRCSFKCDKECGLAVCQNSDLVHSPDIEIAPEAICERFIHNPITEAIVIGGLEGFDTFDELFDLIRIFREKNDDTIVIYTGYYPEEIKDKIEKLYIFDNILIKFGRFIPNKENKFDPVLGVTLASNNQFTLPIEKMRDYYEQRKNL